MSGDITANDTTLRGLLDLVETTTIKIRHRTPGIAAQYEKAVICVLPEPSPGRLK